jgi:TPR repeat protein
MGPKLSTALAAFGLIWACSTFANHEDSLKEQSASQAIPSRAEATRIAVATTVAFAKAVKANDLKSFYLGTAPEFQMDVSLEKFDSANAVFLENHADLTAVENVTPLLTADPSLTPKGRLHLDGYFLLTNGKVNFAYEYVRRATSWELAGMHIVAATIEGKDAVAIVATLREKAEQGDPAAQFNLGLRFRDGSGVPKDDVEAVRWYRKAAEQGYANAQLTLGYMLANGEGVAKNETEAVSWYRKAAEQGNAHAQSYLGGMYALGHGVAVDYVEAANWYRKAAEQGEAGAQVVYANMLMGGFGVPKNETEAVSWFRKSAAQGNASARKYLDQITARSRADEKN